MCVWGAGHHSHNNYSMTMPGANARAAPGPRLFWLFRCFLQFLFEASFAIGLSTLSALYIDSECLDGPELSQRRSTW